MLTDYLLRLALIIFLVVVSSIRPAHAFIEQVDPTSAGTWFTNYAGTLFIRSNAQLACDALVAHRNSLYPNEPYTAGILTWYAPWSAYNCNITFNGTPQSYYASINTTATCPTATPAYTYNGQNGFCERTITVNCPANSTQLSAGYYDVGTDPAKDVPPLSSCESNHCEVTYTGGNISKRALVGGVYHYYAQGLYAYTGQECITVKSSPTAASALPSPSCASGESLVVGENGYAKCYNISTGLASTGNSASAVTSASTLSSQQTSSVQNQAASSVLAAGGTASDVMAAKTMVAALQASGGSTSGSGTGDNVMDSYCEKNPDASICASQDYGTVADSNLTAKTINVSITPVTVGGAGVCPAPMPMTIHGQTKYFEFTTYCNYAEKIKPILLAFAWLAAASIVVAGFRTS